MPLIQASIREGRPPEKVRELISALTETTAKTLDVQPEAVTVLVSQVPAAQWATGDVTLAEKHGITS